MPRQQKIDQFGGFTRTGVDQSGVQRLQTLAGIASGIGDLAFDIGAKKRAKEGALAGAQSTERDAAGDLNQLELEDDSTIFGEAFNRSAVAAYQAQIDIDSKEELDRIQQENENDPEAFKAKTKAFRASTLKGMPPELAVIVGRDLDSSIFSRLSKVNGSFFKKETERQKGVFANWLETISDDISNAARDGDDLTVKELTASNLKKLNVAVEQGLVDPVKAEQIKELISESVEQQRALGEIDRIVFNDELTLEEQVHKGESFLQQLFDKPAKDLSAEQNASLRNIVGSKVAGLKNDLLEERAKVSIETQKEISNLEVLINTGQGDPEKLAEGVEQLHNDELITRKERTSLLTKIINKQKERSKNTIDLTKVSQKLSGDFPEIVVSQKEANKYYDEIYSQGLTSDMNAETKTAFKAEFVEKLRVVPNTIKSEIENNILSGDADLIRQTADFVDRIEEIPGLPEIALSANDLAFINIVNSLDNLDPSQAVEIARKQTDPTNQPRVESRKTQIKEEQWDTGSTFGEGYKDKVLNIDDFETFFGGDNLTEINLDIMVKEYKDHVENSFIAGDSKDKAFQSAERALTRNWKDSQFGFMRNRPEDYYRVISDNPEWMKGQLFNELRKGTIGLKIDKNKIFLQSDDQTAREAAAGNPSYRMIVIDENGSIQTPILDDEDGNPSNRWMPDLNKEILRGQEQNKEFGSSVRGNKTKQDKESERLGEIFSQGF